MTVISTRKGFLAATSQAIEAIMRVACVVVLLSNAISLAFGHGYIQDPAARNACWQYGFKSCGQEWTMDEKNCGAVATQWDKNNGKCGVCGDAYHLKIQKYVFPGSHATGTITKTYKRGQQIELRLMITVTHKGWSEFRVGDIGQPPITQDKLRYLLPVIEEGSNTTRWSHNKYVNGKKGLYKIRLQLPPTLTCDNCVLQWWWKTGNSWGCDSTGCGMGKGPQETFVNCADIRITKDGAPLPSTLPTAPPATPAPPVITDAPQPPTAAPPSGGCKAIGAWAGRPQMDAWCTTNCALGNCPVKMCKC